MTEPALLVIAKEPLPGHAKTRLCPPCSPAGGRCTCGRGAPETHSTSSNAPGSTGVLIFEGNPDKLAATRL